MSASDAEASAATMGPSCPVWGTWPTDDADEQAANELGRAICGASGETVIMSGDMSRPLSELPFSEGVANALWNACETETISEMHRLYRDAGANAAVTNTMWCSAPAIAAAGLDVSVRDANDRAVRAAYSSASRYVVGAIGPCAQAPREPDAASRSAWREQATRLKWGGVHGFLLRGMRRADEAASCVECVRQVSERPVICLFDCDASGLLADGLPLADGLALAAEAGAHGIGVTAMLPDAAALAPTVVDVACALGRGAAVVASCDPSAPARTLQAAYARMARSLHDLGVTVIGCGRGSTVRHTAAVADALTGLER